MIPEISCNFLVYSMNFNYRWYDNEHIHTWISYPFRFLSVKLILCHFYTVPFEKINIILPVISYWTCGNRAFARNGWQFHQEEKDSVFVFDRNESTVMKRAREQKRRRVVEAEVAVVWKRQHTRWYGGLPDNRHCAPAITRNRTRQHHAGIVRVSAGILLSSLSFSFSLALYLTLPDSPWFIHAHPIFRSFCSTLHKSLLFSFSRSLRTYIFLTSRLSMIFGKSHWNVNEIRHDSWS